MRGWHPLRGQHTRPLATDAAARARASLRLHARRLPVRLAWSAEFADVGEAFGGEKRLQGWSHAKRLAFAEGGLDAVMGWSAAERSARREDPAT